MNHTRHSMEYMRYTFPEPTKTKPRYEYEFYNLVSCFAGSTDHEALDLLVMDCSLA